MEKLPSSQRVEQKSNNQERIEKFIEVIDFSSLRAVLSEILKKSGVSLERLEKVSPDLFSVIKEPFFIKKITQAIERIVGSTSVSAYDATNDKIILHESSFADFHLSDENLFLAVAHELVHSISDIKVIEHKYFLPEEHIRVGLSEGRYSKFPWRTVEENNLLNEGLTELIAEAISVEYFRRKGKSHNLEKIFPNVYTIGKDLVRIIVLAIREKTGQPEDVIFHSLVKTVINHDFNEFKVLLGDEKELSQLVEKIAKINGESDLLELNIFNKTRTYQAHKLQVNGLDHILKKTLEERDTYYNPLIDSLGKS